MEARGRHYRTPDPIKDAFMFMLGYLVFVPLALFFILGLFWGISGSVVGLLLALLGMFPAYILHVEYKKEIN
jgi:hypothetical protein